jgi:hypothetical protein
MPSNRRTRGKRLVFLSHSSRDTWVAKQIAREISACGAKPFLDKADIETGVEFEDAILAFLSKAHELVVLLTPWALDRPYIWAEIGAAWVAGFRLWQYCTGSHLRNCSLDLEFPS